MLSEQVPTLRRELMLTGSTLVRMVRSVLKDGHDIRLKVGGRSMYPVIRDKDVLVIRPLGFDSVKPGDIVAFEHPSTGHLMVHRCIRWEASKGLMRGDGNEYSDGYIDPPHILGLLKHVERSGKKSRIWRLLNLFQVIRVRGLAFLRRCKHMLRDKI